MVSAYQRLKPYIHNCETNRSHQSTELPFIAVLSPLLHRKCSVHLDQWSSLWLQGLWESSRPGAKEHLWLVLVSHTPEDGPYQPGSQQFWLQSLESDRTQKGSPTWQCRVWNQWNKWVLSGSTEQCVQWWHRLARCGVLPRETVHLRGQRWTAELCGLHQQGNPPVTSVYWCVIFIAFANYTVQHSSLAWVTWLK